MSIVILEGLVDPRITADVCLDECDALFRCNNRVSEPNPIYTVARSVWSLGRDFRWPPRIDGGRGI